MKAKDLVDVKPGTYIEVPLDGDYDDTIAKFVAVEPMFEGSRNLRIVVEIDGNGYNTIVGEGAEIHVYEGTPVVGVYADSIQFVDDRENREAIMKFVKATPWDIDYQWARNFYGSSSRMDINTEIFKGTISNGDWLIKRNGRVVSITNETYEVLFR